MVTTGQGEFVDAGLEDVIEEAREQDPDAEVHNVSTRELFTLLLRISKGNPKSNPVKLIEPELWDMIQPGSRLRLLGTRMLQFDAVADRLERNHYVRLKAVCISSLGFLCMFELFAHLLGDHPIVLIVALLCLLTAFGVVLTGSRKTQLAYLSARAIAEMLRVHFFMEAAGVAITADKEVHRRYRPNLRRILVVVDKIQASASTLAGAGLSPSQVRTNWFEKQQNWFSETSDGEGRASRLWGYASAMSFLLAVTAMTSLFFVPIAEGKESLLRCALLVAGPSLLGVAAICQFYLERRGFKANAERYRHSIKIYDEPVLGTEPGWTATIQDIGAQALHEIVDWYVTSVEREICVPR